jgi:hypothetical protein
LALLNNAIQLIRFPLFDWFMVRQIEQTKKCRRHIVAFPISITTDLLKKQIAW